MLTDKSHCAQSKSQSLSRELCIEVTFPALFTNSTLAQRKTQDAEQDDDRKSTALLPSRVGRRYHERERQ
eukprot:scaffold882_cov85-Skeletonema_marinoi.AAC.8